MKAWGDEGHVLDTRRAGLPTKPRVGLPRHSGGAPGTCQGLLESPLPYPTNEVHPEGCHHPYSSHGYYKNRLRKQALWDNSSANRRKTISFIEPPFKRRLVGQNLPFKEWYMFSCGLLKMDDDG